MKNYQLITYLLVRRISCDKKVTKWRRRNNNYWKIGGW